MVDMRAIYEKTAKFCKKVAEDVVKHNASPQIIEHAKGYAHLE